MVLAVPSVTMAAWYNPLSWFKKAPASVTAPIEDTIQPVIDPVPVDDPTPLPGPKPIITNTITVTDPKLQSQINTLIQQNTALQAQVASLTTQYNGLVKENSTLVGRLSDVNAALIAAKSATTASLAEGVKQIAQNTTPPVATEPNIYVSPGVSNFHSSTQGETFTNSFLITNNSDVPLYIRGLSYNLAGENLQTNGSQMLISATGIQSTSDVLGYNTYLNKSFSPSIMLEGGNAKTITFTWTPKSGYATSYFQVNLTGIDINPTAISNLPIVSRANSGN